MRTVWFFVALSVVAVMLLVEIGNRPYRPEPPKVSIDPMIVAGMPKEEHVGCSASDCYMHNTVYVTTGPDGAGKYNSSVLGSTVGLCVVNAEDVTEFTTCSTIDRDERISGR